MALVHHFPTTKGTKYHEGFKSTFVVVLGVPSCPLWFNPSFGSLARRFSTTKDTKYREGFKSTFVVVLGDPSCPLWFNPSSVSLVVNQFTILFIPSLRCVTLKLISNPAFMPLSFK